MSEKRQAINESGTELRMDELACVTGGALGIHGPGPGPGGIQPGLRAAPRRAALPIFDPRPARRVALQS
jgi:hypothetical protein